MADGRIHFSPTIELGHILQAIVILGTIGGWALIGYYTIQKQIDANQYELSLVRQQMKADEAATAERVAQAKVAATASNLRLDKISDQIADIRALIAPFVIKEQQQNAPRH